ncbi:MAG: TIGR04438 family Trp-rich protein [Pseudomonadota bacterium]
MYAVVLGLLLVLAKVTDFGPFGSWSWWIILAPFLAAVIWWQFSDAMGITKRREIERLEDRKRQRRAKALEALGVDPQRDRQIRKAREAAERRNQLQRGREDAQQDREGTRDARD